MLLLTLQGTVSKRTLQKWKTADDQWKEEQRVFSYIFYFAWCFPWRTHLKMNSSVYYASRVKKCAFSYYSMKHFLFLLFESLFKTKVLKYVKKQKFRNQILNICLILGSVTFSHSHKNLVTPVKLGWVSIFVSSSELFPAWIDNIMLNMIHSAKLASKIFLFKGLLSEQS